MRRHSVVLLQGDGIGAAQAALWAEALPRLGQSFGFTLDCQVLPFGKSAVESHGAPVPPATLEAIRKADASLLFAVDSKGISSPVGTLRKTLQLYADLRPVRSRPGRPAFRDNLDLVFIRESTQGFLPDRNCFAGHGEWMSDADSAFSLRVVTREACLRIARYAFDYADKQGRKTITALHKAPIFKMTCGLFLEACRDVARKYPGIKLEEELVDNAAGRLIREPETFDVLLTTNLFGDILSDEGAALVGSLAGSANLGAEAAVFLPVTHQPDYAALATDSYDPLPAAICVQMMLAHLGEGKAGEAMEGNINEAASAIGMPASALFGILTRGLGK